MATIKFLLIGLFFKIVAEIRNKLIAYKVRTIGYCVPQLTTLLM